MSSKTKINIFSRTFIFVFLLAGICFASDGWTIFKGHINGPKTKTEIIDLETFRLKQYDSIWWTEGYYHHMNFPDGSMITISIGFNRSETNVAFVYAKTGTEPYNDYIIVDFDDAEFDKKGFGYSVKNNHVKLNGNTYTIDLDLPKSKVKINYEIIGPSHSFGDNLVKYPDKKTFMYYSLPISWAKVSAEMTLDGKEYKLSGSGNMNHDAGVIFPTYIPSNWQAFWFFGEDHTVMVADHFTHTKFGKQLTQRMVFMDKDKNMFTSTSFDLKWSDWVDASDAPFRYPRNYRLFAQGDGAMVDIEVKMKDVLLIEDLFSNLPPFLRVIAERLTRNGWTTDSWSNYTITYTKDGETRTYRGLGITRWTDLEEEK
jgi:hypothetical protein